MLRRSVRLCTELWCPGLDPHAHATAQDMLHTFADGFLATLYFGQQAALADEELTAVYDMHTLLVLAQYTCANSPNTHEQHAVWERLMTAAVTEESVTLCRMGTGMATRLCARWQTRHLCTASADPFFDSLSLAERNESEPSAARREVVDELRAHAHTRRDRLAQSLGQGERVRQRGACVGCCLGSNDSMWCTTSMLLAATTAETEAEGESQGGDDATVEPRARASTVPFMESRLYAACLTHNLVALDSLRADESGRMNTAVCHGLNSSSSSKDEPNNVKGPMQVDELDFVYAMMHSRRAMTEEGALCATMTRPTASASCVSACDKDAQAEEEGEPPTYLHPLTSSSSSSNDRDALHRHWRTCCTRTQQRLRVLCGGGADEKDSHCSLSRHRRELTQGGEEAEDDEDKGGVRQCVEGAIAVLVRYVTMRQMQLWPAPARCTHPVLPSSLSCPAGSCVAATERNDGVHDGEVDHCVVDVVPDGVCTTRYTGVNTNSDESAPGASREEADSAHGREEEPIAHSDKYAAASTDTDLSGMPDTEALRWESNTRDVHALRALFTRPSGAFISDAAATSSAALLSQPSGPSGLCGVSSFSSTAQDMRACIHHVRLLGIERADQHAVHEPLSTRREREENEERMYTTIAASAEECTPYARHRWDVMCRISEVLTLLSTRGRALSNEEQTAVVNDNYHATTECTAPPPCVPADWHTCLTPYALASLALLLADTPVTLSSPHAASVHEGGDTQEAVMRRQCGVGLWRLLAAAAVTNAAAATQTCAAPALYHGNAIGVVALLLARESQWPECEAVLRAMQSGEDYVSRRANCATRPTRTMP